MPIFQGDWSADPDDGLVSAHRPRIGASILHSSGHLGGGGKLGGGL